MGTKCIYYMVVVSERFAKKNWCLIIKLKVIRNVSKTKHTSQDRQAIKKNATTQRTLKKKLLHDMMMMI